MVLWPPAGLLAAASPQEAPLLPWRRRCRCGHHFNLHMFAFLFKSGVCFCFSMKAPLPVMWNDLSSSLKGWHPHRWRPSLQAQIPNLSFLSTWAAAGDGNDVLNRRENLFLTVIYVILSNDNICTGWRVHLNVLESCHVNWIWYYINKRMTITHYFPGQYWIILLFHRKTENSGSRETFRC